MFANTLTLTIATVAKVMTRNNQDNFGSVYEYTSPDGLELIKLQIRHSTDNSKDGPINRHNVFIERTLLSSTLGVAPKYFSVTATLRDRVGSGPADLASLWAASSTLLGTLVAGLVVKEN